MVFVCGGAEQFRRTGANKMFLFICFSLFPQRSPRFLSRAFSLFFSLSYCVLPLFSRFPCLHCGSRWHNFFFSFQREREREELRTWLRVRLLWVFLSLSCVFSVFYSRWFVREWGKRLSFFCCVLCSLLLLSYSVHTEDQKAQDEQAQKKTLPITTY